MGQGAKYRSRPRARREERRCGEADVPLETEECYGWRIDLEEPVTMYVGATRSQRSLRLTGTHGMTQ